MRYQLSDLIDLPAVQAMMENLYVAAGIPVGMVAVDGTLLLTAGWQDICLKFHRQHPVAAQRCWESDASIDRYLNGDIEMPSCGYIEYICQNGMADVAMPVIIEDEHLATLYLGQFLYQAPDEDFFRAQAQEHGFDEGDYLEALQRVPIFSRQRVEELLAFYSQFLNMLTALGLERLHYLQAQKELEYRESFEKLIATISTRFVQLPSEQIDQVIDLALRELGESIGADRSYVFLRTPDGEHSSCTHEWCAEDVPPSRETKQKLRLSSLPWYLENITSQKGLLVPRIADLPSEARAEKEAWQQLGIRTLLVVPIYLAEQQIGLLGFDGVHAHRDWDDDTLNRLKTVGEIFGNAISRQRTDMALRESEERFRTIFESSAVGMATFTSGSNFEHVNPALCRFLGYNRDELQQLSVAAVTHPEDLEITGQLIDAAKAGQRRSFDMEKRYLRKDGSTIWGRVSVAYLNNSESVPIRSVVMVQDISECKAAQKSLQDSEERLALALQVSNEGVYDWDLISDVVYFSPRYYTMLGYQPDELPPSFETFAKLLHPADREESVARAKAMIQTGRPFELEFRMLTKTGEVINILSRGKVVGFDCAGRPLRMVGTHMDITERNLYREQLEKSRARLVEAQRIAGVGSWESNLETGEISWSDQMYRLVGHNPQEFTPSAAKLFELIHPEDQAALQQAFDRALGGERDYRLEHRVILDDGSLRYFDVQGEVVFAEDMAKPVRVVGTTLDITERKQVELALEKSRARLEEAQRITHLGYWDWDVKSGELFWSEEIFRMLGLDSQTFTPDYQAFSEKIHPDDRADTDRAVQQALAGGGLYRLEHRMRRVDGSFRYLQELGEVFFDEAGDPLRIVGTTFDITERKRAEEALCQSEEQFRSLSQEFQILLDGIPDVIVLISPDLKIVWANQAAAALTSKPPASLSGEICYAAWHNRTSPCNICPVVEVFQSGEIIEKSFSKRDGSSWSLKAIPLKDEGGKVINVIEIASDVTEKTRLLQNAEQASRMASLGELSAGVAHEINNPNALVQLNATMLSWMLPHVQQILEDRYLAKGDFSLGRLDYSDLRDRIPQLVSGIADGAKRISRIVEDLKGFAYPARCSEVEPLVLNDAVQATVRLTGSNIKKATDNFQAIYGEDLPKVMGNRQGIEQVIVNLLINACQALPERNKAVCISTRLDKSTGTVCVEVRDQGVGILPEQLSHITEPFCTTRREVGGTGLGLSVSSRIVREMGGCLDFSSTPGKGTLVTLSLPVCKEI